MSGLRHDDVAGDAPRAAVVLCFGCGALWLDAGELAKRSDGRYAEMRSDALPQASKPAPSPHDEGSGAVPAGDERHATLAPNPRGEALVFGIEVAALSLLSIVNTFAYGSSALPRFGVFVVVAALLFGLGQARHPLYAMSSASERALLGCACVLGIGFPYLLGAGICVLNRALYERFPRVFQAWPVAFSLLFALIACAVATAPRNLGAIGPGAGS